MLYNLEQGGIQDAIIRQAQQQKLPLPDKIANAPSLYEGLAFYYQAFWDLSTTRQVGMGEGPISWLSIAEYCMLYEIGGEQREDLIYHLQHMDSAYLKYRAKKSQKSELSKSTPPKRPRRR